MDPLLQLPGLFAGAMTVAVTVLLIVGWRMHARLGGRIRRLEDALRVYNAANAEMGRQLRAVEQRQLLLATQQAPQRAPEAAAPRMIDVPRTPAVKTPAPVPRLEPQGDDAFGQDAAERRLAELIRARLPLSGSLQ